MSDFMYGETFAPNWSDDRRVPYALIMLRLSDLCKNYGRGKIRALFIEGFKGRQGWFSGEDALAWAYDQEECAYSLPVEQLMLEVATLILDGGRSFENEQWMNHCRAKISAILQKNDLQTLLAQLPPQERDFFESDLQLLKPLSLFDPWHR